MITPLKTATDDASEREKGCIDVETRPYNNVSVPAIKHNTKIVILDFRSALNLFTHGYYFTDG